MNSHYPAPGEKLEDHPIAQIFPMADKPDRQALEESIKKNGLLEAIVLLDGKILDGRNRWESCLAVGVEPRFEFFDPNRHGKSPTEYVLARNLARRHLTPSQRAAIAVEALPFLEAEAKTRQARAGTRNLKPAPPAPPAPEEASQEPPFEEAPPDTTPTHVAVLTKFGVKNGHDPMLEAFTFDKALEARQSPSVVWTVTLAASNYDEAVSLAKSLWQSGKGMITDAGRQAGVTFPPAPTPPPPAASETSGNVAPAPAHVENYGKGRARDHAAELAGVSPRLVADAKKVASESPKLLEQVKAGTTTVNAAKTKLSAAQKAAEERETAIGRITQICGKSFGDAVREGTRLKGREAAAYAALSDDDMLRIRALVESGWKVKAALNYQIQALTRTHKLSDLITRTVANGGTYTLELEGFIIDVKRKP